MGRDRKVCSIIRRGRCGVYYKGKTGKGWKSGCYYKKGYIKNVLYYKKDRGIWCERK